MAMTPESTAAVVLAGGASRRLGRPKQLVDWHGRPLLEHIVHVVIGWPVGCVVVVLGSSAEEILEAVDFGSAIVAINEEWDEGIASSLRVGLDVLARESVWHRAFIALGDQPDIPPEVPALLLQELESAGRPAAVPKYRYQRANPVLVDRSLWPRLMSLEGDSGAGRLWDTHPEWVAGVRIDGLPPKGIDTVDDLPQTSPRRPGVG